MLLTPEQVAERIPLNPVTIRRLCQRGELRATKRLNRWFIYEDSLEEWIAAGERPLKPSVPRARVNGSSSNFGRALQAIQSNTEAA